MGSAVLMLVLSCRLQLLLVIKRGDVFSKSADHTAVLPTAATSIHFNYGDLAWFGFTNDEMHHIYIMYKNTGSLFKTSR